MRIRKARVHPTAGTGTLRWKRVRHPEHNQAVPQQDGIGILSLKTARIAVVLIVR